jgi:hypothetical protein
MTGCLNFRECYYVVADPAFYSIEPTGIGVDGIAIVTLDCSTYIPSTFLIQG